MSPWRCKKTTEIMSVVCSLKSRSNAGRTSCGLSRFDIEQRFAGNAQKILRIRRLVLASSSEKPIHLNAKVERVVLNALVKRMRPCRPKLSPLP